MSDELMRLTMSPLPWWLAWALAMRLVVVRLRA